MLLEKRWKRKKVNGGELKTNKNGKSFDLCNIDDMFTYQKGLEMEKEMERGLVKVSH